MYGPQMVRNIGFRSKGLMTAAFPRTVIVGLFLPPLNSFHHFYTFGDESLVPRCWRPPAYFVQRASSRTGGRLINKIVSRLTKHHEEQSLDATHGGHILLGNSYSLWCTLHHSDLF